MAAWELRGGADLRRITRGLRDMADGKQIRRQFTKELRAAAKPVLPVVKASIAAIPSKSRHTGSARLRSRLSKATRLTVKTSGRDASVQIRVDGRKMPAGQGRLPAYMEGTAAPWLHHVFGGDALVTQQSSPYFYRVTGGIGGKSRAAVNEVLEDVTKRIT